METLSRRVLFTFIAFLALFVLAPVHAQVSSGMAGDYKRGSPFTVNQLSVLSRLQARLDGFGGPQTGYQNVTMIVYLDDNGAPGPKLIESDPVRIYALAPDRWVEFYTRPIPLQPGKYWLVLHSAGNSGGSTAGIARNYGSVGPANSWYGNADNYADGASSPFGAASTASTQLQLNMLYLGVRQARVAGRGILASTPSSGLSANVKRGSRFVLWEPARVFELSAYLDGLGGASGTQKLRYDIYDDANGVPGHLRAQSDEVVIKSGQPGSWVSAHVPQVLLDPGFYWIVIHSGDTGGIARDFGDGAANWYGNTDTYSDGAATTFGAGNTGTVTLAAAVMYMPGPVAGGTLGRTTIGTTPSSGLSANFSRGGEHGATGVPNEAVAMGIWAYLDGKGGGTGTQQVRAAVYEGDAQENDWLRSKVYESEVVTIPAGMSGRWVRFPFKSPIFFSSSLGYWLMLQSGSTGGIVRNYADTSRANWVGFADDFADGAVQDFQPFQNPNVSHGNVDVSIYLEYAVPTP